MLLDAGTAFDPSSSTSRKKAGSPMEATADRPPDAGPDATRRATEADFRAMFELSSVAQCQVELAGGTVVRANRCFCRMVGRPADELACMRLEALVRSEDRAAVVDVLAQLADGRLQEATLETRLVRADGEALCAEASLTAMRDARGAPAHVAAIVRDVTARRQAERARAAPREPGEALKDSRVQMWEALRASERARSESSAAGRAWDDFLSALSHELRTPLTPMLIAVQALGMRHDLPEGVRPALEVIQRNVQAEAQFIDDLLELACLSRGRLRIDAEPADLHAAVQAAVSACRAQVERKSLALDVALDAVHHTLDGDGSRLRQAFAKVLHNAAKFTPDGGRIAVRSVNVGDGFRLTVRDTGIGIASGRIPGIFEPFDQGDERIAREYGGLGLGLAVAKATAEAHGGSIRAESAGAGRGAALVIELPLAPEQAGRHVTEPDEPTRQRGHGAPDAAGRREGLRVFVVENHDDTRDLLRLLLEQLGHTVRSASSMSEALRAIPDSHCDVLISDIGLPDGDGWELMRRLARRPPLAIAVSGLGMDVDQARSRAAGFDYHLVKPTGPEQLAHILERAERTRRESGKA